MDVRAPEISLPALLGDDELRAAGFIVTLYGDVVEPRGGLLWMGSLVETCALVGISETRVRTAVSRLVAAGRLSGTREGRRSYYRLTDAARREFAGAAARIFAPPPRPAAWRLVAPGATPGAEEALAAAGFAPLGGGFLLGPDLDAAEEGASADGTPTVALGFRAVWDSGAAALRDLAEARWHLSAQAAAYAGFLERHAPLDVALDAAFPAEEVGFLARTLLVHRFRAVVLRDPRLPAEALPEAWPEAAARRLFARLYLRFSDPADSFVGRRFLSQSGPLPARTDLTRQRCARLQATVEEG